MQRRTRRRAAPGALGAALVAAGPLLVLGAMALRGPDTPLADPVRFPLWLVAAFACGALATAGGLLLRRHPRPGRIAAAVAVAGFVAIAAPSLAARPGLALALLLPAAAALLRFFGPLRPPQDPAAPAAPDSDPKGRRTAALVSSALALAAWLLVAATRAAHGPLASLLALASLLLAIFLGVRWLAFETRLGRARRVALLASLGAAVLLALAAVRNPTLALSCLLVGPLAALVAVRLTAGAAGREGVPSTGFWHALSEHPARLLVSTFAALVTAGAIVLALPVSAAQHEALGFVDAAFTAVSATCVTGLTAVDTATAFSAVGQATILLLIQLGGLGIMTFYTAGLVLLGRRIALRQEAVMADLLGRGEDRHDLGRALAQVLIVTLAFELLGALALTGLFRADGLPLGSAAWRGAFTAISAFCNAGFALSSDNLIAYQRSPLVLHVVAVLIIAGGLGPAVIAAVPAVARRRRVPLQVRIALAASAALLVCGAVLYAAFEWRGSLAGLPALDRLHNAWFQSVTTRTAGFNSVDLAALGPATATIVIALMFIGGSPGSTAGGIKTTTAAVLVAAVRAALRGRPEVTIFRRRIPHRAVYRAAAILSLYTGVALTAIVVLELTQTLPPLAAAFEVVSALGTVGLTIGGTPQLDGVGKIVIMACMFLGRVGPLTLFISLADREAGGRVQLPEEDVSTG